MELVRRPETSAADLGRVISRDAALAARVLKISNSALYGVRGTITTLSRAIVILGMRTLQSLVVAASSESLYRSKSFKDQLLWDHAVAAALVSRSLAKRFRSAPVEEAFVAGLLHDIGKAVLDANMSDAYQQIVQIVYNEGTTFVKAEQDRLGFNHCHVGAFVVRKWNFAPLLQEAVRWHHEPDKAEEEPKMCATVSLANAFCVKLGVGPERIPDIDLLSLPASRILGLNVAQLDDAFQEIREQLEEEEAKAKAEEQQQAGNRQ